MTDSQFLALSGERIYSWSTDYWIFDCNWSVFFIWYL